MLLATLPEWRDATVSGNSQRHDVEKAVRELLSSRELRDFRDYWALYEQTAAVQNVEGFYVRDDPEHQYCNVAVIGDGRVVDVEGDDGDRSGGGVSVRSLSSIDGVSIIRGPLVGFPRTEGASLVAIALVVGQTSAGAHWAAWNEDQEHQLASFVRALVIASSRT